MPLEYCPVLAAAGHGALVGKERKMARIADREVGREVVGEEVRGSAGEEESIREAERGMLRVFFPRRL